MITKNTNRISKKMGFSLIELMVSLTIFSIVMVISISTLLTIIDANAKAQALYGAMTNISFAVDSMTRNIRTSSDYYCTSNLDTDLHKGQQQNCSKLSAIAFTREKDGKRVGYRLNATAKSLEQEVITYNGSGSIIDNSGWLPITASSTVINDFAVTVVGSIGGDSVQPKVSLFIRGYVNNGLDTPTPFALQTNVTERILNY